MTDWYNLHVVLIQGTLVSILLVLSVQIPLRCGVFSFAGIGSYGIGAYATAIMMTRYHGNMFIAILLGMAIAAIVGYLLGLILHRLDGLYLGMATVSFDLIVTVMASNGGSFTGGAAGIYGVIGDITTSQIAALVLVIIAVAAYTERGRLGRRIEAVRDDPQLSIALGINVGRVRRLSFVASGLLGACAGGFNVVLQTTTSPTNISFQTVVLALIMIVIGGARSWAGAVLGAIVFTWLPSVLQVVNDWRDILFGIIVIAVSIWIPGGIIGSVTDLFHAIQASRRDARAVPLHPDVANADCAEGLTKLRTSDSHVNGVRVD